MQIIDIRSIKKWIRIKNSNASIKFWMKTIRKWFSSIARSIDQQIIDKELEFFWLWLSWRALLDQLKFEPFDSLWSRAGSMNASVIHEKGVVKVFQVVKQPISDIFKQIVVEFDVIHLWSMLEEIAIDIYQSVVIQCSHYQIWERLEVITSDWIQSPKCPSKDKNVREEIL